MSAEEELLRLKKAITDWATAPDYEEGCRRWSKVARLIGIEVKK